VQAGYIIPGGCLCCFPCDSVWELAVRYEELDDVNGLFGQNDRLEWTSLGVNLYLHEHNLKIQADYTWRREQITPIANDRFQIQLQVDY